jgi:hypothetical protein
MIIENESFSITTEHVKGTWHADDNNDSCDFELIITTNDTYGSSKESVIVIAPPKYVDRILEDYSHSVPL